MIGNLSKCFLQIKRCVVALWDEKIEKKSTISKTKKNCKNLLFFFSSGPIEPTMEPEPEKNVDALSIVEKAAALAEKYSTQYSIKRDDSTDELLKSVHAQREARKKQLLAAENDNKDDEIDSGRSTPEHLKKYSGCCATSSATDNTDIENGNGNNNNKRLRTFSETLKMLDDDILQELDVK